MNKEEGRFEKKGSLDHVYPATKVSWIPDRVGDKPDLLGTAGDYLRLWEMKGDKLEPRATLTGVSSFLILSTILYTHSLFLFLLCFNISIIDYYLE